MKPYKKPIDLGPVAGILLLPLLFLGAALSIPYTMARRAAMARSERRFADSMKVGGRTIDWGHFMREINDGHGTLIIERFSLKGPIRMWWTEENIYEVCPYPLVDWFTLAKNTNFDATRDWCHNRYTSASGGARLVDCNKEQWHTIRGASPLTFQEGIRYFEVPPPRKL